MLNIRYKRQVHSVVIDGVDLDALSHVCLAARMWMEYTHRSMACMTPADVTAMDRLLDRITQAFNVGYENATEYLTPDDTQDAAAVRKPPV